MSALERDCFGEIYRHASMWDKILLEHFANFVQCELNDGVLGQDESIQAQNRLALPKKVYFYLF